MSKHGFTFIETLIYIAIVGVVLAAAFLTANQLIFSEERTVLLRELTESQRFLMQKIAWVLQGADAIVLPAANSSGGSLAVNKLNYLYNPLSITLNGSWVDLGSGATTTSLTNDYVIVNSLNFTHRVLSGQTIIEVDAVISNRAGTATIDTSFTIK